jgi:ElaB/YqjD/DUF883 family membrane-anchored ribosome-binding protein
MTGRGDLQRELEALRRELRQVPRVAEEEVASGAATQAAAAPPPNDMRGEIERVLRDLQERLGDATDEAEDLVAAHPLASVAAAFLLGVLVANFMSRAR